MTIKDASLFLFLLVCFYLLVCLFCVGLALKVRHADRTGVLASQAAF